MEHLVATGVGEADPAELHGDRAAGQLDAVVGRVGDVGRGVDDADDAAPARDGVLHLVEDLGGLLHRHGEEVDEEEEGEQLAEGEAAVHGQHRADDEHDGGREPRHELPRGEGEDRAGLRPDGGLAVRLDRGVDAGRGAVLDAVGADRLGADDRLRDRTEHVADPLAHLRVGAPDDALELADDDEERHEAQPHDEGERRAVDDHEHGRQRDLREVDHQHQTAELHEHRDRVDVGGHARDERAAALGVLGQHGEVVDVAEGLEPQASTGRSRMPGRAAR